MEDDIEAPVPCVECGCSFHHHADCVMRVVERLDGEGWDESSEVVLRLHAENREMRRLLGFNALPKKDQE